jgi:hypothetical protein
MIDTGFRLLSLKCFSKKQIVRINQADPSPEQSVWQRVKERGDQEMLNELLPDGVRRYTARQGMSEQLV